MSWSMLDTTAEYAVEQVFKLAPGRRKLAEGHHRPRAPVALRPAASAAISPIQMLHKLAHKQLYNFCQRPTGHFMTSTARTTCNHRLCDIRRNK
jgi:hypothetical protein